MRSIQNNTPVIKKGNSGGQQQIRATELHAERSMDTSGAMRRVMELGNLLQAGGSPHTVP